jgi:Fe-S-cluster containining protein
MKSLDEYLYEASNGVAPKAQQIPRQWVPGVIRWPLRILLLPFIWLDGFSEALARFFIRPPLKRIGQCKQRGVCCYYILFPKVRGIIGAAFHFWATQINGFYLRDKYVHYSDGRAMRVYGCRYLKKDGKCGQHKLRPSICRKWPMIAHFGRPKVVRGCGFKAVSRKNPLHIIQ